MRESWIGLYPLCLIVGKIVLTYLFHRVISGGIGVPLP
jgi:hypothetical protein